MSSNILEVLQNKISVLEDEKQELEGALSLVEAKLEAFKELLVDEGGVVSPEKRSPVKSASPKKRGRPAGSRNKKKEEKEDPKKIKGNTEEDITLYEEAMSLGGDEARTDPEIAECLRKRYRPLPRREASYGGVKIGGEKRSFNKGELPGSHISIDDED